MGRWTVLSAPPTVSFTAVPASVSGARVARVEVSAKCPPGVAPDGCLDAVSFRFLVLNNPLLGVYHEPPPCSSKAAALAAPVQLPEDCVEAGCNATSCVYQLVLPQVPGTNSSYTVKVRCVWRGA